MENLPRLDSQIFTTSLLNHRLKLLKLQIKLTNLLEHAQRIRRLRLINLAHREAHVNQHVIANAHFILAEHADIDVPFHPANFNFGNGVFEVDNLDYSSRYGQTHLACPPIASTAIRDLQERGKPTFLT